MQKPQKIISRVLSSLVILSCIVGFVWKSFDCLFRYLEEPQGSEISNIQISNSHFPLITVCPAKRFTPHEFDVLGECGLNIYEYIGGDWVGNCSDPLKLYEDSLRRHKVNIVIYTDGKEEHILNQDDHPEIFNHIDTNWGRCVMIRLNGTSYSKKNILEVILYVHQVKEIASVQYAFVVGSFDIHLGNDQEFFAGRQGVGPDARTSIYITGWIAGLDKAYQHEFELPVEFDYFETLPTKDNNCSAQALDSDLCLLNEIHQESMDTVGCTTPYGLNKSHICTNKTKGIEAIKIYESYIYSQKSTCVKSCNFVTPNVKIRAKWENGHHHDTPGHTVRLKFPSRISKIKSVYSYTSLSFFAEVGGYLGIFIGYAILDITDFIEHSVARTFNLITKL